MTSFQNQRRFDYRRMQGQELGDALNALGLTVMDFAEISGAREDRIRKWLNNVEPIPPFVPVLCGVLTFPEAMAMAWRIADHYVTKSPRGER